MLFLLDGRKRDSESRKLGSNPREATWCTKMPKGNGRMFVSGIFVIIIREEQIGLQVEGAHVKNAVPKKNLSVTTSNVQRKFTIEFGRGLTSEETRNSRSVKLFVRNAISKKQRKSFSSSLEDTDFGNTSNINVVAIFVAKQSGCPQRNTRKVGRIERHQS